MEQKKESKGMAIAGLVTSILGVLWGMISIF